MPEAPTITGTTWGLTGAGGYVGGVLARGALAAGARVVGLGRTPGPAGVDMRPFSLEAEPAPGALAGIDVLVHCAYDFQAWSEADVRERNVEGTRRLFAAAGRAGVRRIVFISSISAFPGCRSLYGRAKLAAEEIAAGQGAAIVRPGLVFGPRPRGMLGAMQKLVHPPLPVPLVGRGDALQYLAHEDDLGELVRRVAAAPSAGEGPILAAHPRGYTLREILAAVAAARGRTAWFVPVPSGLIDFGLRTAEAIGLRPKMRRDSLVGLLHPNPAPDFSAAVRLGVSFRPFGLTASPVDVAAQSRRN